jgi:ABC-2 type transport system ATP-binding protein
VSQDLVVLDQLTRQFQQTKAIDSVSFSFNAGDIFGFIGPNGAGKTTAMRILSTLDIATTGDCYIDGVSVTDNPEIIHKKLGFMPDYFVAPNNVTIEDYLDYYARNYGLKGKHRRQSVERIIDFMDMTKIRDKNANTLSKGMKQRLCLGRTLINDPQILILDEPAAGLDPRARIELRELLKVLAKQGKAILISSHILTELSELCDSCAIIEKGKILRAGKIDTINEELQGNKGIRIIVVLQEKHDNALLCLSELPFVENIEEITAGKKYEFVMNDVAEVSGTLQRIVGKGLPIVEFYLKEQGLEQLFLDVTKGEIQ